MNKQYVYINGNIIIEDEDGEKRNTECYDNLEDILIQENVIETIKNEIYELEEQQEKTGNLSKGSKIWPIIPFFECLLTPPIINALLMNACNIEDKIINTSFGEIAVSTLNNLVLTTSMTPLGAVLSFGFYSNYINKKKKIQANNYTLDYLREILIQAEEELQQLEKEKVKIEKTGFGTIEVNDKEIIENLKNHIILQYDCAYDGKKYYHYYKKHRQIPKKLKKQYNENGQQIIIEFLEEKGPQLVKKK